MEFEEFMLLSDVEKEEIVLDNGTLYTSYNKRNTLFDVYVLFDFSVCFCYDIKRNQTTAILAYPLDVTTELQPNRAVKNTMKSVKI